jgi:epoxyqueuosine reductase
VIAVGLVYDSGEAWAPVRSRERAVAPDPTVAKVARYARGEDYHELMLDRLRALQQGVERLVGRTVRSRPYVDTGPVLERAFAARAGLGWIGKNTCLIDPDLGSYLFLGVLLTELELEPDVPEMDHCGSCRACLDVCPTDAFEDAYLLDARRCIAYSTIEESGLGDTALRDARGSHVFGCDLCQEVCPWNRRPGRESPPDPLGLRERLSPRSEWREPALSWLLELDEESWRTATRRSAMRRTGYEELLRNALVAAGNSGEKTLAPAVARFAEHESAVLAETARWALAQLDAI